VRLTCTDHRIIEILGLRPSNRLPVSYYWKLGTLFNSFLFFFSNTNKKCIASSLDFQRPIRTWNHFHTLDDNFLFGFCKNRTLNHKFSTECGRWQNLNLFIYMYSKSCFLCVFRRIVKARKIDAAQCNCIVTLYIYGPCCREIWRFVYPKKSYFLWPLL
jgi:hypothetical protein